MPKRLLTPGSWSEASRFSEILRKETVGGLLLLFAAGVALVWANSPWSDAYHALSEFEFGPDPLHLHMSVSTWTADGLLAIFFFVVGLELKREFVAGDLRDPGRAVLPIAAAFGGMIEKSDRETPDAHALDFYARACTDLGGVLEQWRAINTQELPRLNADLGRRQLPRLPMTADVPAIACTPGR